MKTVITIGRQFGSGGKEVGIRVAKELGIPFYDKELLQEAAKKSGLCEKIIEEFALLHCHGFLYVLSAGSRCGRFSGAAGISGHIQYDSPYRGTGTLRDHRPLRRLCSGK